jgi:hypothetical protein
MCVFTEYPQTYPQIFVDIALSTTSHRGVTTSLTALVRRRNLPQRVGLVKVGAPKD